MMIAIFRANPSAFQTNLNNLRSGVTLHLPSVAELAKMVPSSVRDWCTPSTHLVHGKPYEQILGMAGDRDVDLIVIGVHGRSALDVALFGSTTNQVIRGARCPVLTARQ